MDVFASKAPWIAGALGLLISSVAPAVLAHGTASAAYTPPPGKCDKSYACLIGAARRCTPTTGTVHFAPNSALLPEVDTYDMAISIKGPANGGCAMSEIDFGDKYVLTDAGRTRYKDKSKQQIAAMLEQESDSAAFMDKDLLTGKMAVHTCVGTPQALAARLTDFKNGHRHGGAIISATKPYSQFETWDERHEVNCTTRTGLMPPVPKQE